VASADGAPAFSSIWASDRDDVWVLTEDSNVLRWDGGSWTLLRTGATDLRGIHGGASGVWVYGNGGRVLRHAR
jgi:hypothetical protein